MKFIWPNVYIIRFYSTLPISADMESTTTTTTTTLTVATPSCYSGTKVKLASAESPNDVFEVPIEVVHMSSTIKNMLDDLGTEGAGATIPIANVRTPVLQAVIEYCTYHIENPIVDKYDTKKDEVVPFDAKFVDVDQSTLFERVLAANYLDIKPLLDLICKTIANMIKGKSPEEIRKTFNIKNDFTPEEEEAVRKENEWCEDKV